MATAGQGRLKFNYVVHAVGPMWCLFDDKQRCAKALRRTFMNALYYANNKLKATSIVLPAIGTGAYVRIVRSVSTSSISGPDYMGRYNQHGLS